MRPKINMITIEAGTAPFSHDYHPHITIYRDAAFGQKKGWDYARTYCCASVSSMLRAFVGAMKLVEKERQS